MVEWDDQACESFGRCSQTRCAVKIHFSAILQAKSEPTSRAISVQVLERISFLLRSPAAVSATTPLLVTLQAYARAGADTAKAVWQCPGMQKALQGLLEEPAGSMSSAEAAGIAACAMTVVRLLASSSPQMLNAVAASGNTCCCPVPQVSLNPSAPFIVHAS